LMSRILIISPGSPSRNPRPLKEADTLGRAGHDVTLLTLSESPECAVIDRDLVKNAPFRHEAVGATTGQLKQFLQRAQQRVAVKATSAGFPTLHALGSSGPLRQRAREFAADLTIVHNEIPFWIGCDLLDLGRRVAADFEDWYSEDLLPAARRGRPLKPLREIEHQLLRDAAYVSTTSAALSTALAARFNSPAPHVLTNSFPLQSNPRSGASGSPPTFFWFSQTLGPGRGLEFFCDAWIRTKAPSRLVLVGEPTEAFDRTLLGRLPAAFASRVTIKPLVQPNELPQLIAQHDIGLALEQSWIVNRDLTITNKILQYLNAGLAVVATPTAGQREVAAKASGTVSFIQPESLDATAGMLDELISNPTQLAAAQRSARLAAETTYCWEREAPRLVQLVAQALNTRAR
ncbi:MAG: glycosyltransferase, partial [Lacunisphaera sp.]